MPRAAYLIPGRGGLWGGWRRDVRVRRFHRSLRVGRRGGATKIDFIDSFIKKSICDRTITKTTSFIT